MNRSTISVKTLVTIRSIFKTKKSKIQKAKSILVRICNNISLFNKKLRQVASVSLS